MCIIPFIFRKTLFFMKDVTDQFVALFFSQCCTSFEQKLSSVLNFAVVFQNSPKCLVVISRFKELVKSVSVLFWHSNSVFPHKHVPCQQNFVGKAKLLYKKFSSLCTDLFLSFTEVMVWKISNFYCSSVAIACHKEWSCIWLGYSIWIFIIRHQHYFCDS